jgi:hypothetical protein
MKTIFRMTVLVVAMSAWLPAARAQEPQPLFDGCHWIYPRLCVLWQQRKCWCPDDYCPKPLPCVRPGPCGCVDDYCFKKLPWVPPNAKGCADDYCPKTCPILLGSNCEPWYTCGPPQSCGKYGCGNRAP